MKEIGRELWKILTVEIPIAVVSFFVEFAYAFDINSLLTMIVYLWAYRFIYDILGVEGIIILTAFAVVKAMGHFWALRKSYVPCTGVRFLPLIGGYVEVVFPFTERWDEGFASLAPSIWVYVTALTSFSFYLITGNFSCMMLAILFLAINFYALLPISAHFDGGIALKSILFSFSRYAGLSFMFVNIFVLPALVYWLSSEQGQEPDHMIMIMMLSAGVNRFMFEYKRDFAIESMRSVDIAKLSGLYILLLLAFAFSAVLLGIQVANLGLWPRVESIMVMGIISITLMSFVEDVILLVLSFKRRIFGSI